MINRTTSWKYNAFFFLTGQAISLFGSMIVHYSILWHITLATGSAMSMTLYVVVCILPIFFISPFGGLWADRYNRKHLINLADGGTAFVSLVAALIILGGGDFMAILFICGTLRALGQGIQMPSINAFIPVIIPATHLSKINGINTSIQSLIQILSPMAGGALMMFMPLHTVFLIDVGTASIGIVFLYFFVKTPKMPPIHITEVKIGSGYFKEIREGFRYVYGNRFIWQLVLINIALHIFITPSAFLTPLQTARNFGKEVWRLTAIEVTFAGGMLLGGLAVGFWGGFKKRTLSLALSCFFCGLLTIGFGTLSVFWLYCLSMFFMGLFIPLYSTPEAVLLQTKIDNSYMGRVMSVFSMSSTIVMPLSMLIYGPLGDILSIDILLIVSGILLSLLSIPLITSSTLRNAS